MDKLAHSGKRVQEHRRTGNVRINPAQLLQSAATRDRGGFARGLGDFNELARAGKSILQPLPQFRNSATGDFGRYHAGGSYVTGRASAGGSGLAPPAVGGRAMMSRPGQAYLRNQLLGAGPGPSRPGRLAC